MSEDHIASRDLKQAVSGVREPHTPGPWTVELRPSMIWHVRGAENAVCFTSGSYSPRGKARNEANARLISAAPDLLSALTALRDAVKDHPDFQKREFVGVGIQVTNAIAKATGQ